MRPLSIALVSDVGYLEEFRPLVMEFCRSVGHEDGVEWSLRMIGQAIRSESGGVWMAVADEGPAGYILAFILEDVSGRFASIIQLYTSIPGSGRELVSAVEQWCRSKGVQRIRGGTTSSPHLMLRLLGMKVIGCTLEKEIA